MFDLTGKSALITGAFAERFKYSALLLFTALWSLLVYAPICHWVWGGGFLGSAGVLDFAGGAVVHVNAGVAGLVCALVLGPRHGFGRARSARQAREFCAQVLLQRAPGTRRAGSELVSHVVGHVADGDGNRHACILAASTAR